LTIVYIVVWFGESTLLLISTCQIACNRPPDLAVDLIRSVCRSHQILL